MNAMARSLWQLPAGFALVFSGFNYKQRRNGAIPVMSALTGLSMLHRCYSYRQPRTGCDSHERVADLSGFRCMALVYHSVINQCVNRRPADVFI